MLVKITALVLTAQQPTLRVNYDDLQCGDVSPASGELKPPLLVAQCSKSQAPEI